jgi:hypothetical protein
MRLDSAVERARLRRALAARHTWVAHPDLGPRAVDAGECERCGAEARLVTTCGPGMARMLGRRCAAQLGEEAWCAGHLDDARQALRWLAGLPPEADAVARLWWVATGEVRLPPERCADELRALDAGALDDGA